MAQQPWSPDEATSDEILAAYRAGVSARAIAKRFGVADVTIVGFLRRRGVETRNRSSAQRKWTVNENAFDALTPEAIYWIGFLLADGNIFRHPKHSDLLSVGLKESDAGHVEKLKTFLGSNKPLYFHKAAVFFSVQIHWAPDWPSSGLCPERAGLRPHRKPARTTEISGEAYWMETAG